MMSDGTPELALKIITVGDSSVGKSSLITRFVDDSFSMHFASTIGIDFKVRKWALRGRPISLLIWDTAGQERFRTITTAFYRGAKAVFIVYDVSRVETFESVRYWIDMCRENCLPGTPIFLVANKADLMEPGISDVEEMGRELARVENLQFEITSAKSGVGVEKLFEELAIKAMESEDPEYIIHQSDSKKLSSCKCE